MATPLPDQVELVQRAQAGDQQAFADLFDRFHQRILNYTYRTLGDRPSAEDVTQEAFIQAYRKLDQLGPPHDFKSWVYRIAGNMALYRLRQTRPDRQADLDDAEGPASPGEERPPEGDVLEEELGSAVRKSLARIPAAYRQALVLREIHQVPYREMTLILERSYDSVRQLVHRARTRFMEVHVGAMLVHEGPSRCDVLGDLLSGSVDGELGSADQARVEQHVETCRVCQATRRRLREAGTLLASLPTIRATQTWKQQTLQRAFDSRPPSVPRQPPRAHRPATGWRWGLPLAALAAAATVTALATGAGALWMLSQRQASTAGEPTLPASVLAPAVIPSPTPGDSAARPPAEPTVSPVPTRTPPVVVVDADSRCRRGPGVVYATVGYLNQGQRLSVTGRDAASSWWLVERGSGQPPCWVWDGNVILEGDPDGLPEMTPPPVPTATPEPSATPQPTATQLPPPAAPANLTITDRTCTPSLYRLTLVWTDQASNEDGFRLYRDGFLTALLDPNTTSHIVYPPRGGPHQYSLEAFNASGSSAAAQVNEKGCS